MVEMPTDVLLVSPDTFFTTRLEQIVALAAPQSDPRNVLQPRLRPRRWPDQLRTQNCTRRKACCSHLLTAGRSSATIPQTIRPDRDVVPSHGVSSTQTAC